VREKSRRNVFIDDMRASAESADDNTEFQKFLERRDDKALKLVAAIIKRLLKNNQRELTVLKLDPAFYPD
jgi:hypothetical protein